MIQNLPFWQVDAFTRVPFKGNPAAVVVSDQELSLRHMQNIAAEMNLPETAFILLRDNLSPLLRWFTPTFEMDLCGHATLASAHIMLTELQRGSREVTFETTRVGSLHVERNDDIYTMNFPARSGERLEVGSVPLFVKEALGNKVPFAAYKARDLMLVYDEEKTIYGIEPDFHKLKAYPDAIIVTAKAKGTAHDFVSRFFCANDAIMEDPVSGSAHCTLAPYWAERFGKNKLEAYQASARGGDLSLEVRDDRVFISSGAVTVLDGKIRG